MANMLNAQKNKFLKMNALGNDFIIFDARFCDINLDEAQIQKLCDRKNIGCDQLVIIKSSQRGDCFMEIYNQDGSASAVCGNATRCVAALIMAEKKSDKIIIDSDAGPLKCWHGSDSNIISVEMRAPVFTPNFIFSQYKFFGVNMGNPHAVAFVDTIPEDSEFFKIAPQIENDIFFPHKTNVEFAKIISNQLIEVRVWERGAGETLACGSGACAVAVASIQNKLTTTHELTIRFKGGDLQIKWLGGDSAVIMSGGYNKIFAGAIDENFCNKFEYEKIIQ